MELRNIELARKLFPDAVKLQLRIDKEMTDKDIRRLLPSSVVLLSCKISKNYANVIYSEGAAESLFPDITMCRKKVDIGHGREVGIYDCGKDGINILVNFLPMSDKILIDRLEQAFGDNLIRISSYEEADMGCIFFNKIKLNDLLGILTLYREENNLKEV